PTPTTITSPFISLSLSYITTIASTFPSSLLVVLLLPSMTKSHQFPAFGCWDHCDELPITQYFESAVQAGLIGRHYFGEDGDLFKVSTQVRPAYHHHHHRKVKKGGHGGGEKHLGKEQQMKQERASDLTLQITPRRPRRAPKAVDEDLYKIPPELLHQKPKRVSLSLTPMPASHTQILFIPVYI
ncbi:unnamed protein product, partial [Musa hybrid cultivar]